MRELQQAFAATWPGGSIPDGVGDRLARLCAEARVAWPALAEHEFVAAVAARCPRDGALAYLERCRGGELALAIAAGRGDAAAIAAFERAQRPTIDAVCRRFATTASAVDDLRQLLREKLFVGPTPRIADYAGQGQLANWLRVTATRLFIDLGKRKDREREAPASASGIANIPDPADLGLELIKVEYRAAVHAAIATAASRLAPGDRYILRQHFVDGLTIDQLGVALGIHRATAARRIARAREQLIATTRDELAAKLAIAPRELDEMCGLVASRLDVSIGKLLATRP
jgi:RNA polymerase sigma-70 factor (ECF subfamily)